VDELKAAREKLTTVFQGMAQDLYSQAQANQTTQGNTSDGTQSAHAENAKDKVVGADVEVIDDANKNK
jgi:hypothetical protein